VVSPGGTAFRRGNIEGYTIGGKTGSGQQGRDRDEMTVSYIAYTPVENPEFIILGVLDHLSDRSLLSGETVVPMVTETMEAIFQYRNMRPNLDEDILSARNRERGGVMNDYTGMQLAEVVRNLNNLGIDYLVSGSGTIVSQHIPAAGQLAPTTNPVYLYLDPNSQYEDEMSVVPNVVGMTMEQGEAFIRDAHFTPVSFLDRPEGGSDMDVGDPVTTYPTLANTGGNAAFTQQGMIYRQFPNPGAVIQKGTQIKLRVRME
jgi:stage V sporulation protein D (sporulation-specific penicillin-binding protein)